MTRFSQHLKKKARVLMSLLLSICLLPLVSSAQMRPSAPVTNFALPMFDEAGNKTWDLAGREGRYISQEQVDVVDMKLTLYRGSQVEPEVEAIIASPFASVFINQTRAEGTDGFLINAPTFRISGTDWTWEGEEQKITVRNNAQVIFLEDITSILR